VRREPAGRPERFSGSQARPEVSADQRNAPHENAAVKRRKARRSASSDIAWSGGSRKGRAHPQGGPRGAAIRTSACRRFTALTRRDGARGWRGAPAQTNPKERTMQRTNKSRPTIKERRQQARSVRYRARTLAFCNALEFWQMCSVGACRRNHACRGDTHACFGRHWRRVPDDEFAMARDRIDERERLRGM
jgi:hypothetical protein